MEKWTLYDYIWLYKYTKLSNIMKPSNISKNVAILFIYSIFLEGTLCAKHAPRLLIGRCLQMSRSVLTPFQANKCRIFETSRHW
jgi:hypothetical protein